MAILKLSIDDILCENIPVFVAINSPFQIYRIAYKLNEILKIRLKKNNSSETKYLDCAFDTYSWVNAFGIGWELISNKTEIPDENANLGLFKDLKKVIYLTQDKIDYILKIKNDNNTVDENLIISKINQLLQVTIAQIYQPKDKDIIYKLIH